MSSLSFVLTPRRDPAPPWRCPPRLPGSFPCLDPVLRAHQEPDLAIDLDCITCTYKGGKPGEAVGERESVPAPAAWRYHTDISLEKDARSDSPAP
ncbi:unnamed protein product [Coccothraustes coccothraustes]